MPPNLPAMSTSRPSLTLRMIAMLMLAVIGLHALPAHAEPPVPIQGSAFSAATVDVAVAVRRDLPAPGKQALAEPLHWPQPAPILFTLLQPALPAAATIRPPRQHGPPPHEAFGPQLSPRAPPIA